jgi:hypothetical protein
MANLKFSRLVYELDLMVRKAFRADSCRIVFIPERYGMCGVFMEGPYNFRELVQVSLQNTLAQEIIQNKNCTCITMPSSLICGQQPQVFESPEQFTSVTGQEFEAVKYLAIVKPSGHLFAIMEVCWNSISQAQIVHENSVYLGRKDQKIVSIVRDAISQTYLKLSLVF